MRIYTAEPEKDKTATKFQGNYIRMKSYSWGLKVMGSYRLQLLCKETTCLLLCSILDNSSAI